MGIAPPVRTVFEEWDEKWPRPRREHVWDGEEICVGPAMVATCSVCGLDEQADPECYGE